VTDFTGIETRQGTSAWQAKRGPGKAGWTDFAETLLANFAAAVEGREELLIEPESVVTPLAGIDALYAAAESPLPSYYREWAS
jgi:hypothetical protein